MHNSQLNELSIPQKERISPSGRENTLSSIIEKIAKQSTHLSSVGYKGLCVGKFTDKTNWKPEGENVIRAGKIQERDNHGRTYIYFCPHDRVMGSLPLRSIGWQGLPNDKNGNPHPLIVKFKNNLYQRMLARIRHAVLILISRHHLVLYLMENHFGMMMVINIKVVALHILTLQNGKQCL
ncbi:hypothetical protein AB6G54_12215 [Enterobacter hormaechei]